MKKKLAVLGTAVMAAIAITACGGTQTQTTTAETTTQAPAATEVPSSQETQTTKEERSEAQDKTTEDTQLQSEDGDVSHAEAQMEADEIKPFAEKVQKAVADKDMEALADLCAYPVYVSLEEGEGEEIADRDAFLELNEDQLFTDDMMKEIADTDVDTLEQFGAGVIMGNENNIIFNQVDGQVGITGINLQL
ncbi:hypothetical protein LI031_03355 [Enterocloster citroniae]|uniref:hypothetical protein n=1 Tax=Enterocloster citroniae TaxID=358743 RepID=UPI001D08BBDF|nr:hypothetical protein [Enterocloster citroniae]MCB7062864.1 hypothetical protein [Enterocloster citroniae]